MRFVVGLGNPGERHRWTRHNVGFMVVDALAGASTGAMDAPLAWRVSKVVGGRPVVLVKPMTFMNRSGPAVAAILEEARGAPGDLIVVVDDAALDPGRIRVRPEGGHGGHNGLRSLIEALGTGEFPRVRVGVGGAADLAEHVLSPIPERDMLTFRRSVERATGAVVAVLEEGVEAAMNRFNVWPLPDAAAESSTETPRS